MTTLYLVRHGQTDWNAQHRWQGIRDVPLNAVGTAQAEAVASAFRGVQVDRVYSSDLSRAVSTASGIATAAGVVVQATPTLRERSFGRWEGMTRAEILEQFPEDIAGYEADRDGFRPTGGQSWHEFALSAVAGVESLAAECVGLAIAVVAHGGPIKAFINAVLGIASVQPSRLLIENAGVTTVRMRLQEHTGEQFWQLVSLNNICHLNNHQR
jgi:probable phosphoglycerate mutase